jgi:hypothetical protein
MADVDEKAKAEKLAAAKAAAKKRVKHFGPRSRTQPRIKANTQGFRSKR